ncbi:GAF domain-containing protein [Actinopolymorpha sp. NPDC004070]|uniref:GAF domain-containing protein n=1 Tax=Actinopolymorpha sp. NPDC004070 TaxID=3154548 RepID=UPI0033A611D1
MAIDTQTPLVVADLPADERYDPPPEWRRAMTDIGLGIAIPLVASGEALGALVAVWRRGSDAERAATSEFDDVQMFASHAAAVLQRVRTQQQHARSDLWLEAAGQLARLLLTDVDRDHAMRTVGERLQQTSGADIVGVIIADACDTTNVASVIFEGLETATPPDVRLPRQGLVAAVLDSGEPIVSKDYTRQHGYDPPAQWSSQFATVGLGMLMPMAVDGEVLGVLFAGWRRNSPHEQEAFTEAEQVQTFADLAALALYRSRSQDYHDQLIALQERDRLARELGDAVLQRLYAAGLQLVTSHDLAAEPQLKRRLMTTVHTLDQANEEIRKAFFHREPTESGNDPET